MRTVAQAASDYATLAKIGESLSASVKDLPTLIATQATQLKESDQLRRKLEKELAGHRAAAIFDRIVAVAGQPRVAILSSAAPAMDQLRVLGQATTELPNSVLVATTAEGNGLLVATSDDSGVDAGKLIRDGLATVGGKGGGSPRLAQGTAPSAESLRQAFEFIEGALKRDR
jgi:alanyl-tRNA synthetase